MTEKPKSYMERMREISGSLAAVVPQAAHRARIYALEDNGAADLAHRKRALRESIANSRTMIFHIEQRQAGADKRPPLPPELAERLLAGHRKAIAERKEKLATIAPAASLIAPMTRRVAREDRRRARKNRTSQEKP